LPTLDALMREAGGFAMGAFELTDLIGHDVNYAVTCSVFDAYYRHRFQPSLIQKELVDGGRLGRKSGQGFYSYARRRTSASRSNQQKQRSRFALLKATSALPKACWRVCVNKASMSSSVMAGPAAGRRRGAGLERRAASQRAREDGLRNLILLDLALDYSKPTRIAISCAAGIDPRARSGVALLQRAGFKVSLLADSPAWRSCARWPCSPTRRPMRCCKAWPRRPTSIWPCAPGSITRGPLAWADAIGPAHRCACSTTCSAYGEERYRPSLLLRRRVAEGETSMTNHEAMTWPAPAPRPCSARQRQPGHGHAPAVRRPRLRPGGHDRARRHDPGPRHLPRRLPVRPADSAFAFACNSYNEATVAIGCSIDYIAPARLGDTLNADCTEQSRSGRTGNYDVRIENQQGQLIALFHGKSYKVRGTGAGAGEPE
jgi:hypothetical protein